MSLTDALPTGDLPTDTLGQDDPTAPAALPQSLVDQPGQADPTAVPQTTEVAPSSSAIQTGDNAAASAAASAPLPAGNGGIGNRIVQAAMHYLGVPYVWGGTSAAGLDCSGLVQLAYKSVGINLPRISFQQANTGSRVSLKSLRPGDLVAWDNSSRNAGADHIAVFAGYVKGRPYVIEAPHPGGHVQYVPIFDAAQAFGVRMGW